MTFRTDKARVKYRVAKDEFRSRIQSEIMWCTEVITAQRVRQHIWDKVTRTMDPFRNAMTEAIIIFAEDVDLGKYNFEAEVLKALR